MLAYAPDRSGERIYMSEYEFVAICVVLFLAALAGHITKAKWQKKDRDAQAVWDEEEAAKAIRHDEPSWHGPEQCQHLGLVKLIAWGATLALAILVAARYSAFK